MKSYGQIALAEDISKQTSTDCVMWLLVASLMQICNQKEQAEQGKIQNIQLEEKRSTRKCKQIKKILMLSGLFAP